jgi:hypothetical protein
MAVNQFQPILPIYHTTHVVSAPSYHFTQRPQYFIRPPNQHSNHNPQQNSNHKRSPNRVLTPTPQNLEVHASAPWPDSDAE